MSGGIVVDLFAGGGGASVGIEAALSRPVDLAIDHSSVALAVHRANHPETRHLEADIWEVKPTEATGGAPVELLWASPDCTHFSVARGNVPRCQGIRSLAWVVVDWAREVRPRVILLENVQEFLGWGPLDETGRPDKARMGETFRTWCAQLERLGYTVDHRILDASHYGAPTRRRRLFLVARRDGLPIRWPEPTHGAGRLPARTAAECIDWSLPCPSIFNRRRPLVEKTLWRIAEGIRRFVLDNPEPYIVGLAHGEHKVRAGIRSASLEEPIGVVHAGGNNFALVTPSLVEMNACNAPHGVERPLGVVTSQHNRFNLVVPTLVQTGYGERPGQAPRALDLEAPIGTLVDGQKHGLVAAFLAKHFSDRSGGFVGGQSLDDPAGTVTTRDHNATVAAKLVELNGDSTGHHIAEVRAFLTAFYGTDGTPGKGQRLDRPARMITARHRLGLVTISGVDYQIVDIGMRMLEPHELLRAQFGRFASTYDLSAAATKGEKVRLIGNSVCPEIAEALVRANLATRVGSLTKNEHERQATQEGESGCTIARSRS